MKQYEVLGERTYHGYEPGEQFSADLSEAEEQRAVARGSISVVGEESVPAEVEEEVVEDDDAPAEEEESPPEGGGLFGREADESKE